MKQLSKNERSFFAQFSENKLDPKKMNYLKGGDGEGGGDQDPPPTPWYP